MQCNVVVVTTKKSFFCFLLWRLDDDDGLHIIGQHPSGNVRSGKHCFKFRCMTWALRVYQCMRDLPMMLLFCIQDAE